MNGYRASHLDDIEEVTDGRSPWRPVRHHFGITSFGANAWTGHAAGDRIINEHEEEEEGGDEELYFVHRGRARFEVGGEQVDAPTGTFVYVPLGQTRTAFAEEPETTVVAVGARPGQAYLPFGWDLWRPYHHLYEEGKYDELIDQARDEIEQSGYPQPLYNLACCEALAGRKADALEHLRLALERAGQLRELAAQDSDLDSLRDEPQFKELLA
jgi:hypothetical protein